MYVQEINQNNNISMHGWKNFKQSIFNKLPNANFKDVGKRVENWIKYDETLSKPAPNRAVIGATALLTQPAIDYFNPKVDKDTKRVSRNRTIAKIVVGTLVGIFAARWPSQILVKKMTNIDGISKWSKALLPKSKISELKNNQIYLKNYRAALSTSIALGIMLFTNFLLDAPLTVMGTNKLNKLTESKNEKMKEVANG